MSALLDRGYILMLQNPEAESVCNQQWGHDHPRRVDNPSFVCRIVASTEKMYGHIWLVANNPTIMARCYVKDVAAFHFDHPSIVHGCSGSS